MKEVCVACSGVPRSVVAADGTITSSLAPDMPAEGVECLCRNCLVKHGFWWHGITNVLCALCQKECGALHGKRAVFEEGICTWCFMNIKRSVEIEIIAPPPKPQMNDFSF